MIYTESVTRFSIFRNFNVKKILFFTLYDNICLGTRILSSIARNHGIETHLVIFKDQRTRAILRDSKDSLSYQFYFDGIKYGSCYAAYKSSDREIGHFVELVNQIRPDVICLSTRSFGYALSKKIIGCLKPRFDIPVIAGGWGPTLEPDKFLEFCDYVCFGEGEIPIAQISSKLNHGDNDFSDVENLIYRQNGTLTQNPIAKPLHNTDLNQLPFADFDLANKYLIDSNKIYRGGQSVNTKIYNCLAGRGCPLSCSYCMSSKYRGLYKGQGYKIAKYRIRDVEVVIEELKIAKANGALYIRISDEIFPIWKDWIDRFIDLYRREIDLPFFAYIRPEFHDDEVTRRLVEIGMTSSVVAIQAGSEYIRKKIFKRMLPKKKIMEFAKTLNAHNIEYTYHLINHNPFESESDMIETLQLLYRLPFAPLVLFRLVPFEGTPIKRMIQAAQPEMLPVNLQKWYGYLYAMAVKSSLYRAISRFIYKKGWFRNNAVVLTAIFGPAFIKLHIDRFIKKLKYGSATLLPIPTSRKNKLPGNQVKQPEATVHTAEEAN